MTTYTSAFGRILCSLVHEIFIWSLVINIWLYLFRYVLDFCLFSLNFTCIKSNPTPSHGNAGKDITYASD